MSLSQSRDQQAGSSASPEDPPLKSHLNSPDCSSFTSFPEGEGATNPDIPLEPVLNKIYNKVISLTTSGKSAAVTQQQQPPQSSSDARPKVSEPMTPTGLGISLGSSHQSKNPSVSSVGPVDTKPAISSNPPHALDKVESNLNRQSMVITVKKTPDVLDPVVSTVNAVGGLPRSEDEFSVVGSDKAPTETQKPIAKSSLREINLPGLPGFRLMREPSSDSESISSFSAHPARTVKSIIGRLKTGDLGREFWMKDETSHECFLCGEKFTSIHY
jgi:hypothetical protein